MFKFLLSICILSFCNCAVFNSVSQSSQSVQSISTSLNSISTSLNSISSISGSLGSISKSSSSEKKEKEALYQKDLKDLTNLYIRSNTNSNFLFEIESLAFKYGFYDWRSYEATFLGIGQGLKKAGVSPGEMRDLSKSISNKKQQIHLLELGYNS